MVGTYWCGPWHLDLEEFDVTIEEATLWGQRSIIAVLVIGGPPLIAALIVGLVISIFQAVTQIQEQTLAIIPKMAAMLGILAMLFPWMLAQATTYMASIFTNFPSYVGG